MGYGLHNPAQHGVAAIWGTEVSSFDKLDFRLARVGFGGDCVSYPPHEKVGSGCPAVPLRPR